MTSNSFNTPHIDNSWIEILFSKPFPKKVLVRVDAGKIQGVSFGHLSRCLSLAKILCKAFNCEISFCINNNYDAKQLIKQNGFNSITFGGLDENQTVTRELLDYINKIKPDYYLIDLPYENIDTQYFQTLRSNGIKLFFIDDWRFLTPNVDCLLNANILAPEKIPASALECMCLGPDYFIFPYYEQADFQQYQYLQELEYILITMGGSDPTGLTQRIVEALSNLENTKKIIVITGPGFGSNQALRDLVPEHDNYEFIQNPKLLIPYLYYCTFTICAGGLTMYELYKLGKNFLPIASTHYEAQAIAAFKESEIIDNGLIEWDKEEFKTCYQAMNTLTPH